MRTRAVVPLAALLTFAGLARAADKTGNKASGEPDPLIQLDGCLQGTPDADTYILKIGTTDVEVHGPTRFKEHVGQRVAATGVWIEGRTETGGKQNASTKRSASTKEDDRYLAVAAIRTLADSCEAP